MAWYLWACLPPFLWSLSSVFDQMISRDYFKNKPNIFLTFTGLTTAVFAVGLYLYNPNVLQVSFREMLQMLLLGGMGVLGAWLYFLALDRRGAEIVVPIFQTIPAFVILLAYIFLSETITSRQSIAAAIIIFGSLGMTIDVHNIRFYKRTWALCFASSIFYAAIIVLMKYLSLSHSWETITFWTCMAWVLFGLVGFTFLKAHRKRIMRMIKKSKGKIIFYNTVQDGLDIAAHATMIIALTVGPSAGLVNLLNGLQPLFIFAMTGVAFVIRPDIYDQVSIDRNFALKAFSCLIMFFGLYFLTL